MTAEEYLKEKGRLTKNCRMSCFECKLGHTNNGRNVDCKNLETFYPEDAAKIIEKWLKECPPASKKSRLVKFIKLFPDIKLYDNLPLICPRDLGFKHCGKYEDPPISCERCKEKFWLEEIKEE